MDIKTLTVASLVRQLSQCDQKAEIRIVIGNIPQSLPVEAFVIRENIDSKEIVTLVVEHQTFVDALDYGVELIEGEKI